MQLKTIPEDFIVVEQAKHATKEAGQFLLIELTKRNMTTERAIAEIGEALRLQRKAFGYAGTKDSRALTKQYVTVRAEPGLDGRVRKLKRNNISVRVVGFADEQLRLGMLEANRFEIVARKIEDERVVARKQVPNYFDEQRFSRANAEVGRLIVKSAFKEAAELIAKTDPDAGARIDEWLSEHKNDYVSALKTIPRNTLLMYVHAYQSQLFNEVLSAFIRRADPDAVVVDGPVQLTVPSRDLPPVDIPIFGFGTEADPMFGSLYGEVLQREGLEPRDFVIRSLPFLTAEGGERAAFFEIDSLEIGGLEDDDLHPGFKKQRLSFILPKGCYATLAVKVLYRVGRVLGERSG